MERANPTNAVQCSRCHATNPTFFIQCKKCGKKLGKTDPRVYDAALRRNPLPLNWSPLYVILLALSLGAVGYFALKAPSRSQATRPTGAHSTAAVPAESPMWTATPALSGADFLTKVKEDESIMDAFITDVKLLCIAVTDDGENKDELASRFCRLAKEYQVAEVTAVKVIDAASAEGARSSLQWARELGRSICD